MYQEAIVYIEIQRNYKPLGHRKTKQSLGDKYTVHKLHSTVLLPWSKEISWLIGILVSILWQTKRNKLTIISQLHKIIKRITGLATCIQLQNSKLFWYFFLNGCSIYHNDQCNDLNIYFAHLAHFPLWERKYKPSTCKWIMSKNEEFALSLNDRDKLVALWIKFHISNKKTSQKNAHSTFSRFPNCKNFSPLQKDFAEFERLHKDGKTYLACTYTYVLNM